MTKKNSTTAILLFISSAWFGLVFGLSFIEAPLKFQAPGITTALGLGIGQLVFGALNKIELVFSTLLILILAITIKKKTIPLSVLILSVVFIVFLQSVFLLPILDHRVNLIQAGQKVAASNHHITFIVLEILKLPILLSIFYMTYCFSITSTKN